MHILVLARLHWVTLHVGIDITFVAIDRLTHNHDLLPSYESYTAQMSRCAFDFFRRLLTCIVYMCKCTIIIYNCPHDCTINTLLQVSWEDPGEHTSHTLLHPSKLSSRLRETPLLGVCGGTGFLPEGPYRSTGKQCTPQRYFMWFQNLLSILYS